MTVGSPRSNPSLSPNIFRSWGDKALSHITSLLLFRISLYPSGLLLLTTVRTSRPGRSEWLRLMSQRGGSSRKGGAILVLEDKRGSPGWAATPDSSIRKYSDFRIDASHQPGRFTHTRFRLRSRPGRAHSRMGIRG